MTTGPRPGEALATYTLVPAGYFDRLRAALDEPDDVNAALRAAARRPRRFRQVQSAADPGEAQRHTARVREASAEMLDQWEETLNRLRQE